MRGALADGQRVTATRVARGHTQEQLAALAELDVKTVRKAEQGKRLDIETLSRLAAALDVELNRLVRAGGTHAEGAAREVVMRWPALWDAQDADAMLALYH